MNRSILFLPAFILLVLFSVNFANANVLIEDARVNTDSDDGGITSGVIDTGSGGIGDYELIVCGIDTVGPNPFNAPSPGSWNEIDNSTCFLPDCQIGVWGRFSDSQNSEEVTCSWGNDSEAFVAGSIRYSNVDKDNPIIDSACTEIEGQNIVIRPVSSERGAQLVGIQLFVGPSGFPTGEFVEFDEFEAFFAGVLDSGQGNLLIMFAESELDENGDGFPGFSAPLPTIGSKFCVVSLRMAPTTIPTMSEWGLIAFAAFVGIAGIWFLRRRQVAA